MAKVYLTKEGYEKLQQELAALKEEKNSLGIEIEEAREQGDLKENAGYIYAKEKQNVVIKRINALELDLRDAKIVESAVVDKSKVRLGATVLIEDHKLNKEKEYTLTSADEADPSEGKISVSSPFAQGLLGAKEGDTVVIKLPAGDKKVTILKIAYK